MGRGAPLLLVLVVASGARAEMPERLRVAGASECPTVAAVARALARLHPALRIETGDGARGEVGDGAGERVEVVDRGHGYEVRAATGVRRLSDGRRRCRERATAAALALTLLLDPPPLPSRADADYDDEPAPPSATPRDRAGAPRSPATASGDATSRNNAPALDNAPPRDNAPPSNDATARNNATSNNATAPQSAVSDRAAAPSTGVAGNSASASKNAAAGDYATARSSAAADGTERAAVVARRRAATPRRGPPRLELELTGVVDGAADSSPAVSGGGAARIAVGGRHFAGTVGLEGLAPVTAHVGMIGFDLARVPFDGGLRVVLPLRRLELGGDIGVALAILRLSAPALAQASPSTRLDVGARFAAWLRLWVAARLGIQLGAQMVVSFAPYDLTAKPEGKIGTTARIWLGGGAGLVVKL
jgi:hypothetical protein